MSVPLVIAVGLHARAQWAWYLGMLFGGWYTLRNIAVLIGVAVTSRTPDLTALLRSTLPTAGLVVLSIALVVTLARPETRVALDVRLRARVSG